MTGLPVNLNTNDALILMGVSVVGRKLVETDLVNLFAHRLQYKNL